MGRIDWLPALVLMKDFQGNWGKYVEALYKVFQEDFIDSQPSFRGEKVSRKRLPIEQGKEATFWHIISEGSNEADRTPNFRRCERIRWPRSIVQHETETVIKVWEEDVHGERRFHLWLEEEDYVVVLAKRRNMYLLWTAFVIEKPHQRRKFQRRYEAGLKS